MVLLAHCKVSVREQDVVERKGIYLILQVFHRIMQWMYRMSQSCKIFVSNTKANTNTNKNNFPAGRGCWEEYLSVKRMLS
jgi:hypothetical protein